MKGEERLDDEGGYDAYSKISRRSEDMQTELSKGDLAFLTL